LGGLISTRQQNDQIAPTLLEIHPISRPIVDPQFRNTLANRLDISRVSRSEPFNSDLDARTRLKVIQGINLQSENICFANFNHDKTVA
jgi:hypothetical protein